jgi:tetratricopeptide (TPR) repeat protein
MKWIRFCLVPVLLASWSQPIAAQESYNSCLQAAERAKAQGDFSAMEAALKNALRFGPSDEYAWRSLAWAQAQQGRWRESLDNARENVRRNGECGWSLHQLTESAILAGEIELARDTLRRAENLSPSLQQNLDFSGIRQRLANVSATRKYKITYVVSDKSSNGPLCYLIPALTAPRQTVQVNVEDAQSWKRLLEQRDYLLEVVPKRERPFRIIATATLQPFWLGAQRLAKVPPGPCPTALQSYLGPFRNGPQLDPSQADCLAVALPLQGRTGADSVQNVLDWLRANMIREPPFGPDTLSEILRNRHGLCHHHANLMPSLCRATGVPAVIAHGTVLPDQKGETAIGHGWVEVFLNGLGWVPVEPMNPASLRCFGGANYLLFHTTGHTKDQNHFTPRYRSLQGYTAQVERLQ